MDEATQLLRSGILSLVNIVEDRVLLIKGDLIEPLEVYMAHHEKTKLEQFDQAQTLLDGFLEKEERH